MKPIKSSEWIQSLGIGACIIALMVFLAIKGILLPIVVGLLALNAVILIHESGHYWVAKKCGVGIRVFSVGMGPRWFGFRRGGIDYRVSALPIGGYVRMEGESLFEEALKNNDRSLLEKPGTLFGTSPWKRIAIAFAGAGANLLSAVFFFFAAYAIGFSNPTDKIVAPLSHFYPDTRSAADDAGFRAGDLLLSVNRQPIHSFYELPLYLKKTPAGESVSVRILRGKETLTLSVQPRPDADGDPKIGLVWLIGNRITEVKADSPFAAVGLQPGDRLMSVNGIPSDPLSFYLFSKPIADRQPLTLSFEREGQSFQATLSPEAFPDDGRSLGIAFEPLQEHEGGKGLLPAVAAGLVKPVQWIADNFKGLYQIAVDRDRHFKDNAAGPIGVTAGIGMTTLSALQSGFANGVSHFSLLIAIISSIIAVTNLLPIPALDGGIILFTFIEAVRRRRFSPKTFYYYQLIGFLVIISLTVFVLTIDIKNIPFYFQLR